MTNVKQTLSVLAQDTATTSRIYRSESSREVRARAEFLQQVETGEERAGLERLKRFIGHENSLNKNVPRGFYLNIRV